MVGIMPTYFNECHRVSPISEGRAAVKPTGEYPFLSLEVKAFVGRCDVDVLSLQEYGLLMRLVFRSWKDCGVPSCPADLARLVGATENRVKQLLPKLAHLYEEHEGRIKFAFIEAERERVTEMLADKSRAGTRSVQERDKRKQKRLEYRRKAKEQKAVNAVQTGVRTGVPHTHTDILPHTEPSLTTNPEEPDSTGAKIRAPGEPLPGAARGPLPGLVDSALHNLLGTGPESGNGEVERYARELFYELWPHDEFDWRTQKESLMSSIRKYSRGSFNVARGIFKEHKRENKRMGNEVAYLVGIAREDWSNRKRAAV